MHLGCLSVCLWLLWSTTMPSFRSKIHGSAWAGSAMAVTISKEEDASAVSIEEDAAVTDTAKSPDEAIGFARHEERAKICYSLVVASMSCFPSIWLQLVVICALALPLTFLPTVSSLPPIEVE
eukprot:Gb_05951 [translate_table: standard]